jgi:shikimate kinase
MTAVLITGMSGTGKSAVLGELARRGHRTVDTDEDEWSVEAPLPDGGGMEQRWRKAPMTGLLAEPGADVLFVAGCVANQVDFYDRFDAIVLLSAPSPVMLSRITARTTNPFGQSATDRARILADLEAVEPLLRRTATVEIVTDRPLAEVVTAVEEAAAQARDSLRSRSTRKPGSRSNRA